MMIVKRLGKYVLYCRHEDASHFWINGTGFIFEKESAQKVIFSERYGYTKPD